MMDRSKVYAARAIARSRKQAVERARERWSEEVPERFSEFEYERDIANSELVDRENIYGLRRCIRDPRGFIVFHGPAGTGKTTLAAAFGGRVIDWFMENEGRLPAGQPMFATVPTLLREISDMDVSARITARAATASLLVLDDAGAANEGMTDHQQRVFWGIINERYSDPNLVTIITTNLPLSNSEDGTMSLRDWLGPSAWDRISNSMHNFLINGESLRGKGY